MSDKIEFGADLEITKAKCKALQLITEFQRDKTIAKASAYYPKISKDDVIKDLNSAITKNEYKYLSQGNSSLCGPAAFFFGIARSRPDIYTQAALGLYKNGKVRLENLKLESSRLARKASLSNANISGIDWMIMSSIKPWYDKPEDRFSGITLPGMLTDWLEDTGYQAVDKTGITKKTLDNLLQAQTAYAGGYTVFLFVNGDLFKPQGKNKISFYPDHWVMLNSSIKIRKYDKKLKKHKAPAVLSAALVKQILKEWEEYEDAMDEFNENGGFEEPTKTSNQIELDVFTWGERHQSVFNVKGTSQKPELRLFFNHYYGFIKARR
ncbi:MAG TPA: hypothetical protein ENJ08_13350 [Gammaproteobacteria bacterium]|nr:hypothetical protein [Gammaproteobacteria bacterium]